MRLHHMERDECAGTAEPRLTMHSDQPLGVVRDAEEAIDHFGRRRGAVLELEVVVPNASRLEVARVVVRFVEPDHGAHIEFAEDVDKVRGGEGAVPSLRVVTKLFPSEIYGALKCDELARNNDGQVAVQRILVMIVLLWNDASPIVVISQVLEPAQGLTAIQSGLT